MIFPGTRVLRFCCSDEVLDAILELYVEQDLPMSEIVRRGFDEATVRQIGRMVKFAEYKRRQAPMSSRSPGAPLAATGATPSARAIDGG